MNTRQPVSHEFFQPSMFCRLICAFFVFIKLTALSVSMSTQTILKITKFNDMRDILRDGTYYVTVAIITFLLTLDMADLRELS